LRHTSIYMRIYGRMYNCLLNASMTWFASALDPHPTLSLHNYSIRSTLTGTFDTQTNYSNVTRNQIFQAYSSLQYIVRGPCAGTNTHAIDMQVKEKLCAASDAAKRDCKHFHA
ncbi:hypothetical protein COCVIDRAFT_105080, partial [Bipolaris victoriae FI3]